MQDRLLGPTKARPPELYVDAAIVTSNPPRVLMGPLSDALSPVSPMPQILSPMSSNQSRVQTSHTIPAIGSPPCALRSSAPMQRRAFQRRHHHGILLPPPWPCTELACIAETEGQADTGTDTDADTEIEATELFTRLPLRWRNRSTNVSAKTDMMPCRIRSCEQSHRCRRSDEARAKFLATLVHRRRIASVFMKAWSESCTCK
jgi:hypothetical protein